MKMSFLTWWKKEGRMNKNFKVIRINGLLGLFIAVITVVLAVGSIAIIPIYGVKFLWNSFVSTNFGIPTIKLSQASLLWFALVAAFVGYLKSKVCLKFVNTDDIQDNMITRTDYEKFMEEIKKEQEENEKIHH